MGAKRVTPKEIVKMQQLYNELGSYTAVAQQIHRSPSTVARYVRMDGVPRATRIAIKKLIER